MIRAEWRDAGTRNGRRRPHYGIAVDGWVLPEPAHKDFAEGRQQKVTLMIGNNSQEFNAMMGMMMGSPGATPAPDIRQMITQRYGPLADRALAVYGLVGGANPARSRGWNRDDAMVHG